MVLGKKVAIFDWEWGRNSVPREGQKIPCKVFLIVFKQKQELDLPLNCFIQVQSSVGY